MPGDPGRIADYFILTFLKCLLWEIYFFGDFGVGFEKTRGNLTVKMCIFLLWKYLNIPWDSLCSILKESFTQAAHPGAVTTRAWPLSLAGRQNSRWRFETILLACASCFYQQQWLHTVSFRICALPGVWESSGIHLGCKQSPPKLRNSSFSCLLDFCSKVHFLCFFSAFSSYSFLHKLLLYLVAQDENQTLKTLLSLCKERVSPVQRGF